jgi:hypothetical protein
LRPPSARPTSPESAASASRDRLRGSRRAGETCCANPIASLAYGLLFAIAGDLITIFAWRNGQVVHRRHFRLFSRRAAACRRSLRDQPAARGRAVFDLLRFARRWPAQCRRTRPSWACCWRLIGFAWERVSTLLFALLAPHHLARSARSAGRDSPVDRPPRPAVDLDSHRRHAGADRFFALTVVSVPLLLDRRTDLRHCPAHQSARRRTPTWW